VVTIRFVDLFSGIGGFRLGLEKASETYKCVWSCDWDKYANRVYRLHFGKENHHTGDVRKVDVSSIPDHDLLCAGFPCQPFSIAGKRKGFQDPRGTLFFEILRIAEAKKPPLLLLENVRGLLSNNRGQTFYTILRELGRIGYWTEWQVLNSKHFGVPQNRERVFIIGHLRGKGGREIFPIAETDGMDKKVAMEAEIKRVIGSGREMARVYSPKGVAPTIRVPSGGWHQPNIATCLDHNYWKGPDKYGQRTLIAHSIKSNKRSNISPILIVADRSRNYAGKGRSLESPKKVANTLSSVQKDNLLVYFSAHTKGNIRNRIRRADTAWCLGGSETKVIQLVGDRDNPSVSIKNEAFCISSNPMSDRQQAVILNMSPIAKPPKMKSQLTLQRYDGVAHTVRQDLGRNVKKPHNPILLPNMRIRRLTPIECERLQGFPDGWTEYGLDEEGKKVKISDTQRYKLLGNAVTTNVVEFLGKRILEK